MRVNDYTLRNLRTFCAVVEHGGFGGAQAVLGAAPSLISTHLKDLEIALGFRLCHRGRGGFSLSPKGEAVYLEAKQMLASIEASEANLGSLRHVLGGQLRVGIVDSEDNNPDLPIHLAIRQFFLREQEVRLRLEVGTPEELSKGLQTGDIHVAIGPFPNRQANTSYTPVYVEEHGLYCGKEHPLYGLPESEVTLESLSHHPMSVRPYLHRAELAFFKEPRVTASVSNMEGQAMLIASGCFLGFLPIHYARTWVERGEMRQIDWLGIDWRSQFYIAVRVQPEPSGVAQLFAKDVEAALSRMPDSNGVVRKPNPAG